MSMRTCPELVHGQLVRIAVTARTQEHAISCKCEKFKHQMRRWACRRHNVEGSQNKSKTINQRMVEEWRKIASGS